jgi:acyl-homoserine-lactone acylase
MTASTVTISYRAENGALARRAFTVWRSHHGPIVRAAGGKWIAVALMNKPVAALEQSFLRTKATNYAQFLKIAGLKANSSNNTIFADDTGEIAYLHPSFIPRRDDRFDYTKPVDGSDPATDWRGLHALDEAPHVLNPRTGWVFNSNDAPWSAAGPDSPRRADFPRYMDTAGENARGLHELRLLAGAHDLTVASLMADAYDSYLPAFARLMPALIAAYDRAPAPTKARLAGQIAVLRAWDDRWAANSVAASLAVLWGERVWREAGDGPDPSQLGRIQRMATNTSDAQKLEALAAASDELSRDFGSWRTSWGQINRFQRLDDAIDPHFDDAAPSLAVPFTSSRWGSLASFGARRYPGTRRYYGSSGNSFVAVVEFGPRVRAVAVDAGGESGDPSSPHFRDQAARYASGRLRQVYFWPDQLSGHIERVYHPGE